MAIWTIELVKTEARNLGYECLADAFSSSKKPLPFRCLSCRDLKSKPWAAIWHGKKRCSKCTVKRTVDLDKIREHAKAFNFKLLDSEYPKDQHVKLRFECLKCKKISLRSWNNFRASTGCQGCHPTKWTLEKIKSVIAESGWVLHADVYQGCSIQMLFECPNGHKRQRSWLSFDKYACRTCSGLEPDTEDAIRDAISKEGHTLILLCLLEGKPLSRADLTVLCPEGHKYQTNWTYFKSGSRCNNGCTNWKPKDIAEIREDIAKWNYTLLSTEYVNRTTPLNIQCPKGHSFSATWSAWKVDSKRCPKCQATAGQQGVALFIDSLGFSHKSDRKILDGLEIDIYIPSLNIGIEYCGIYWHSTKLKADPEYHLKKVLAAEKKGVLLISVFEDDWIHRPEWVKNYLEQVLTKKDIPEDLKRLKDTVGPVWFKDDLSYPKGQWLLSMGFEVIEQLPPQFLYVERTRRVETFKEDSLKIYDCGYRMYFK